MSIVLGTWEALCPFPHLDIKCYLSSYYVLGPELCREVG